MDYCGKQNSASLFHCKWFIWYIIHVHNLHIQSRYTHLLGEYLLFWTPVWQNHSDWEIHSIFSLSLAFSANHLQDHQLFNCFCNLCCSTISKKNSVIEAILLGWDILMLMLTPEQCLPGYTELRIPTLNKHKEVDIWGLRKYKTIRLPRKIGFSIHSNVWTTSIK